MWGLILALLIAILIAGFASLNSAPVTVNLLFWKAPEVSLALVVLFSVLLGVIMAALFGTPQYLKTMRKIRELESKPRTLGSGVVKHEEKKE
jgi:uncharacterized integral membrane protein